MLVGFFEKDSFPTCTLVSLSEPVVKERMRFFLSRVGHVEKSLQRNFYMAKARKVGYVRALLGEKCS